MPKITYPMHVELEDGTTFDVTADQRDVAKWEIQPFGGPLSEAHLKDWTFTRYVAWHAANRQKLTTLTWDKFDDQCVDVGKQEADVPADAEDPGLTAASDTT